MRKLLVLFSFCLTFEAAAAELIWKRSQILEKDLGRALSLKSEEICQELGKYSCLKDVHLYALGANDPFARVQYRAMPEPSQLTTIAFERVVLNACIKRVAKDAEGPIPEVFRFYPLDQKLNQLDQAAVTLQVKDLYRRFLIRDPSSSEENALLALAKDSSFGAESASDFSQALCLAVGSQLEFLFF